MDEQLFKNSLNCTLKIPKVREIAPFRHKCQEVAQLLKTNFKSAFPCKQSESKYLPWQVSGMVDLDCKVFWVKQKLARGEPPQL